MHNSVSSIWHRLPSDIASRIERCIAAGCGQKAKRGESLIFFRADDIAAPGNQFSRLIKLFSQYKVPLCLAVVPAWLTRPRWLAIERVGEKNASLWCWHQHGWRHINHEITGKKQEFGAARPRADLEHDIGYGKRRLENLLGNVFYPAFTPPWNRCDQKTLDVLKELDYAAISRSRGSKPPPPEGLLNFDVNVDLHTRKEKRPGAGWDNLFSDLQQAIGSGRCGIMIHHQRMNQAAFDFLEILIVALVRNKKLNLVHFKDLL
jgi:hypothetical protein